MTGANDPTLPQLSVIVINWNTSDLLAECLQSLAAYPATGRSTEIIVVDNGSHDGSQAMVREHWPNVDLVALPENIGFTRANNVGIRRSRGEFLLFINADALVTQGCLDRLLARMESDPRAGAIGPRLTYADGRWQRWTAGREPALGAAFNYYFFLERLSPRRRGLYLGRDVKHAFQPDWVTSACMLVRRAALDEIGLMDEGFFVYMDDVDLCRRMREANWHVWYEPATSAIHYMGQSHLRETGSVSPRALRTFNQYYARRHNPIATAALQCIEGTGHAIRAFLYYTASVLASGRKTHRAFRSMARAHWIYCKTSLEATAR